MQVVILAAGSGTRLRPLTASRPKSMLHVAGEPLIHHMLASLVEIGIDEVIVVVGHGHEHLRAYLGDGKHHGIKVRFVQQDRQVGAGHALFSARDEVGDDDVLVLPADAWFARRVLERLVDAPPQTMVMVHDPRSRRHGVPTLARGRVTALRFEGDGAPHASAGAYRLPPEVITSLPEHGFRLGTTIGHHIEMGDAWGAIDAATQDHVDVVEARDLLELSQRLLAGIETARAGEEEDGVSIQGEVEIGPGTIIRAGTVIRGPVHIGSNCDIGPLAYLGPGTSIRNHVRIAAFADISACLIASNVSIASHARIRNAAIDLGAEIGSATTMIGEAPIVVGADAHIGHNVRFADGAHIGVGAQVASGRSVADVPDRGVAV